MLFPFLLFLVSCFSRIAFLAPKKLQYHHVKPIVTPTYMILPKRPLKKISSPTVGPCITHHGAASSCTILNCVNPCNEVE